MKINNLNRFWFMLVILALAALACSGGSSPIEPVSQNPTNNQGSSNDGLTQAERSNLIAATVQIIALFEQNGELVPAWSGSGTILNNSGLILTNAHVAAPITQGEPENPDALAIALVQAEDKPPSPVYLAEVLAADGYLDLAVIQITSALDGSNIDPSSLNLPYVGIGDSSQVHVGDHVNVFGFPGIGGDTITFTDGSVSGFTSEDQIGDRAWIKTDATIAGGNSGGLAADDNANIIGVPTQASSGGEGNVTDCRQIQDTNGDGVVNDKDSCIPIGGFINALRPIQLALPLIQAAQAGKEYASPFRAPGVVSEEGSGEETLSGFVWLSSDVDCNPGEVINSYDADALCIVPGFEYTGMTNGQAFREVWSLNGEQFGEYTYSWEWDSEGKFASYMANNGDPLPEGTYSVDFFAGSDFRKLGTTPQVAVGSGGGGNVAPSQPSSNNNDDVATLYGVVTDAETGKPIPGVYVFVLSPGVTYEQWQNSNWSEDSVEANLKTGANGKYQIDGIPRDTLFTVVFSAEGYYDAYGDNLQFYPEDVSPFEMNVQLTK